MSRDQSARAADSQRAAAPDVIAERLRQEIAAGIYAEEQRLPTERELCDRFGVSRATLREAVSKLKHDGILTSRRGAGLFVVGTGSGNSFRISARESGSREDQAQIFELRMVIETASAAMAANRWTPPELQAIRTAVGGFHREAQRFKQTGFRRPCQAPTGTPRPGTGSRGTSAG